MAAAKLLAKMWLKHRCHSTWYT